MNRVEGLDHVRFDDQAGLAIGASARIRDVMDHDAVRERYPSLARACEVMATPQVCNMATVAGNLANAAPCADTAAPLLAHDARVVLASSEGMREVALSEFFRGPGEVDLGPSELMKEILVPVPPPGSGHGHQRISARSRVDMAAVIACAFLVLEDGRMHHARIALGSVAPTPLRAPEAEEVLEGEAPTRELLEQAAEVCEKTAKPIDDVRASAEWRRTMVRVLSRRALEAAVETAGGGVTR